MFLSEYAPEIIQRTGEHLILVAVAMSLAICIGIPLGLLITRQPKLAAPILALANAIQTIPSLAIFGFLISVPLLGGVGKIPAIVALTLYALLPIIRNTYIGINGIDPAIREAGIGMGMTDRQLLLQVEIPLGLQVILAGVRVATVISVGIATIAAAIGAGGLGIFIFRGISTVNNQLIFMGAIPATVIALCADLGLGLLEKKLTSRVSDLHKFIERIGIIISIVILITISLLTFNYWRISPTIIIGSKNFTEQVILGEILAQHIESQTNLKVDRRFNLGGTFICHEAVKAGEIGGYVEYTGTAFTAVLRENPITNPEVVYQQVKQKYGDNFQLEVMPPLGFQNNYALIIRAEDAKKLQVKTLSEVAKYTPQWNAGFGYEFIEREDGYPGLSATYGLEFNSIQQMELGLMYQALTEKKVDLIATNSTDGLIPVLNLVILADDKQYFPPYEAVPIFNREIMRKYPELGAAVNQLAGKISTEEIQRMNYQVDNQSQPVQKVVRSWLTAQDF